MAVRILFELNQELTRLFIAGSRLSSGDPRIKKFILPLKKYGEKAPVFLKLSQLLEELLEVEPTESAKRLIETETFLLSVLSTQGDALPPSASLEDIYYAKNAVTIAETNAGYRTLSPVITALTTTGSGRMEIVQDSFEKGAFNDSRMCKFAVDALGDKYPELVNYMAQTVLPSMGEAVYPFLLDGYNIKGTSIDGRRLAVMHAIKGEDMLNLVEEAADKAYAPVKVEAVKIMANYPHYEETLLNMLVESKSVREEVMRALMHINSKAGIDKMIKVYEQNNSKSNDVIDALSYGTSDYLADKLLEIVQDDYKAVKTIIVDSFDITDIKKAANNEKAEDVQKLRADISALKDKSIDDKFNYLKIMLSEDWLVVADDSSVAKIQRLRSGISALKNKSTDRVANFMKEIFSEDWIRVAEKIMPKDKKQVYYYKVLEDIALEGLYQSGKGDDFIWEMFTSKNFTTKSGRAQKGKPALILEYAFRVGANRLAPEEFYDIFFKTHLYKDVVKNNYNYSIFRSVFLSGENPPPFSRKIAKYFVKHMGDYTHIEYAITIVDLNDSETMDLLAENVRKMLNKNSYSYSYIGNYNVLKLLGETRHKDFKELYELYCDKIPKSHVVSEYRDDLAQFLDK